MGAPHGEAGAGRAQDAAGRSAVRDAGLPLAELRQSTDAPGHASQESISATTLTAVGAAGDVVVLVP